MGQTLYDQNNYLPSDVGRKSPPGRIPGTPDDTRDLFLKFLVDNNLDYNDPMLKIKLKMLDLQQRTGYRYKIWEQAPHFKRASTWVNSPHIDEIPRYGDE